MPGSQLELASGYWHSSAESDIDYFHTMHKPYLPTYCLCDLRPETLYFVLTKQISVAEGEQFTGYEDPPHHTSLAYCFFLDSVGSTLQAFANSTRDSGIYLIFAFSFSTVHSKSNHVVQYNHCGNLKLQS